MSVTAIPKLPNPLRKPYILAKKREHDAMTIAAGLKASDGIVLCSDSQLTVPQYMKFQGRKLFSISSEPEGSWAVGLTYSGDPERIDRIHDIMREKLEGHQTVDKSFVKACFVEALHEVRASIVNSSDNIDAMCALSIKDEPMHLLSGKNGVVTEQPEILFLGAGDSSLMKHLEELLDARFLADVSTAVVTGAYIIEQISAYVDLCGGKLQMIVLKNGKVNYLTSAEITKISLVSKTLGNFMKKSFVYALGLDMDGLDYDEDKEEPIQSFLDHMLELHKMIQGLNAFL